jgi:hypothetical protein
VWEWAHDQTRALQASPIENLLLGINAHINYDLPFALRDELQDAWPRLTQVEREARLEDYTRVNAVIRATCGMVQHEVVDRYEFRKSQTLSRVRLSS